MKREKEINAIFEKLNDDIKILLRPLLTEVIYLEEQMKLCKNFPLIEVNPQNSAQQRTTKSAKLYKELSQSYMNAIRILVGVLHKADEQAGNELLAKLLEFE